MDQQAVIPGEVSDQPPTSDTTQPSEATGAPDPAPSLDLSTTVLVAGCVLLGLIVYLPGFAYEGVTLRLALVAPIAGWGFVELVRLASRGDAPARWAVAFIGWSLVASLLSPEPRLAIAAHLAVDQQWLYQACYLAIWAVGRSVPTTARRPAAAALLVGLGLNALLAVAQVRADGYGILALADGRAAGFSGSSVYLGALMGAGIVLLAALVARDGSAWWRWLGPVVLLATAAEISGSRIALLLGVPLAVAAARRAGMVRLVSLVAAIAVGVLLVGGIVAGGNDASTTSRLEADGGGGGVGTRTAMWKAGLEAAAERPISGWGTARFRSATSARTTAAFAEAEGPDKIFFDAHNLVVEHLVTHGIVGVVLLGGFAWSVARTARGPLAWFALAIVASWLLEPASVMTAPVAMFCLGLASTDPRGRPQPGPPRTRVVHVAIAVLVVLGLAQSARILVGARALEVATTQISLPAAQRARALFPDDPALADVEAQVLGQLALDSGDPDDAARALAAARNTVRMEPTRHLWWGYLAKFENSLGPGDADQRLAAAAEAVERGLEQYPWSWSMLLQRHAFASDRGDTATVAAAEEALCEIGACLPDEPTAPTAPTD